MESQNFHYKLRHGPYELLFLLKAHLLLLAPAEQSTL
jgi:hypothetical protein